MANPVLFSGFIKIASWMVRTEGMEESCDSIQFLLGSVCQIVMDSILGESQFHSNNEEIDGD
jgi:hypothetical protein